MFEDKGKGEEQRSNGRLASVACSRTVDLCLHIPVQSLAKLSKVNHILSPFLPFLLFTTAASSRPIISTSPSRAALRWRSSTRACTALLLFRLRRIGPFIVLRWFLRVLFSALPAVTSTSTGFSRFGCNIRSDRKRGSHGARVPLLRFSLVPFHFCSRCPFQGDGGKRFYVLCGVLRQGIRHPCTVQ